MNSKAPNGRHVLSREIFQLVCNSVCVRVIAISALLVWALKLCCFSYLPKSWGHVSSVASGTKQIKERWSWQRDRKGEMGWGCEEVKVHQTVSRLVWRFGGFPYSFGSHLSKNPNHFLSRLRSSRSSFPSLAALSITTSAFFLPRQNPPPLTISHLCHPDSKSLWLMKGTPSSSHYYNAIIKEQQLCWTCSDSSEATGVHGEMEPAPWCNRLPWSLKGGDEIS